MEIPKQYQDRVKEIDKGLFLESFEDFSGKWIKIKHRDDRNGLVRDVFKVKSLDIQALQRLRWGVDWKAMMENPDPHKLAAYYEEEERKEKASKELERRGFITDLRKDNRNRYKQMFEDYRQSLRPAEVRIIKNSVEKERILNPKPIQIYKGV